MNASGGAGEGEVRERNAVPNGRCSPAVGRCVDTVTIEVADVVRAITFFRTLGLDLAPPAAGATFATGHAGAGCRIDWVTIDAADRVAGARRSVRLGVRCASPADVDRVAADAHRAGYRVEVEPRDTAWGVRSTLIDDPDGHVVEVYAPYP